MSMNGFQSAMPRPFCSLARHEDQFAERGCPQNMRISASRCSMVSPNKPWFSNRRPICDTCQSRGRNCRPRHINAPPCALMTLAAEQARMPFLPPAPWRIHLSVADNYPWTFTAQFHDSLFRSHSATLGCQTWSIEVGRMARPRPSATREILPDPVPMIRTAQKCEKQRVMSFREQSRM